MGMAAMAWEGGVVSHVVAEGAFACLCIGRASTDGTVVVGEKGERTWTGEYRRKGIPWQRTQATVGATTR